MNCLRAFVLLMLVTALAMVTSPALAGSDALEVSADGQTWSADLARPLFDSAPMLVPTDELRRSFYVRNTSGVPAHVNVAVLNQSPASSPLQEHMKVTAVVAGAPSACKQAGGGGPILLPGQSRRLDVVAAFRDVEGQTAQQADARYGLAVSMQEAVEQNDPTGAADDCAEPVVVEDGGTTCANDARVAVIGRADGAVNCLSDHGLLPDTGAPAGLLRILLVGLFLLALGSLLVPVRRRVALGE